jgi:hypothetical protein
MQHSALYNSLNHATVLLIALRYNILLFKLFEGTIARLILFGVLHLHFVK